MENGKTLMIIGRRSYHLRRNEQSVTQGERFLPYNFQAI